MTLEDPILTMGEWLFYSDAYGMGALPIAGLALLGLIVLVLLGAYLTCALQYGPVAAFGRVGSGLALGGRELLETSPRRIWANARLAFKEAIRRKILVAVVVFGFVLLFASWYIDVRSDRPAKLYLGVVMGTTNVLVLLLALFVSTFSLPSDIKDRTIFTLVTKPVRLGEILLGRMLGFTIVGTLILGLMCLFSYVFVLRGISHSHEVEVASLRPDPENKDTDGNLGLIGRTTEDAYHRHTVYINPDGKGFTDLKKGHRHEVTRRGTGDDATYTVGGPVGQLQARNPIYGKLAYLDRRGRPTDKGVNVGNEWTYRTYIEGGSLAAFIWTFEGITPGRFPADKEPFDQGVPLEMTLRVFRTHKGNIERTVAGSIEVIEYLDEEEKKQRAPLIANVGNFLAKEFTADRKYIPRKLTAFDSTTNTERENLDLFEDFAHGGKLIVRIRCLEPAQYYGAAMPDVYVWSGEGTFFANFVKGHFGIWCQMVLIVAFGVMFSTFLNGPVTLLTTGMAFVLGCFKHFVRDVFSGEQEGGGPLESFIRLVEQRNLVSEMSDNSTTQIVQGSDKIQLLFILSFSELMPDYNLFRLQNFVAEGYNIPLLVIFQHLIVVVTFVLVLSILAYFFFRSREIAA